MKKYILITLFALIARSSFSAQEEKYLHAYGALGEIYGPASVRFGTSEWEAGLLNRGSIGFGSLTYKDNQYLIFGPMINYNASFGLFAGVGIEWTFFGFSSIRLEANTGHALDNYSSSEVHIGASIYW
jgi:hypothetical protein